MNTVFFFCSRRMLNLPVGNYFLIYIVLIIHGSQTESHKSAAVIFMQFLLI